MAPKSNKTTKAGKSTRTPSASSNTRTKSAARQSKPIFRTGTWVALLVFVATIAAIVTSTETRLKMQNQRSLLSQKKLLSSQKEASSPASKSNRWKGKLSNWSGTRVRLGC